MTVKNASLEHFNNKEFRHKPEEVKNIMEGNQPADRVKAGGIEVTIWDNGNFGKSVTITKNYKDKTDEWKKTSSLKINDIPKAVLALSKAYEKIVLKE